MSQESGVRSSGVQESGVRSSGVQEFRRKRRKNKSGMHLAKLRSKSVKAD